MEYCPECGHKVIYHVSYANLIADHGIEYLRESNGGNKFATCCDEESPYGCAVNCTWDKGEE